MRLHKYNSDEEYRETQVKWNKRKLGMTWVKRSTIEQVASYIEKRMSPSFGLCHGTRRGKEQLWFRELLGIEVVGTEISDTASQFPHTVQWDFHRVNPDWVGSADFIYSNSFDHSHSPDECLDVWIDQLVPDGLCFIEWTDKDHGPGHVNSLDCFGATIDEMRDFLPVADEIPIEDKHVVFVVSK